MRVDDVLADLDAHVDGNDHFEFFWVPHTGWALTKREQPHDRAAGTAGARRASGGDDYADGELRLRRGVPARAAAARSGSRGWRKALPSSGASEYIDQSYRVFASPRLVRFYEMEYAIPREACAEALNRVRRVRRRRAACMLSFPVEVRFTAADDIPLSTGHGRADALHRRARLSRAWRTSRTSRASSAIMDDYGGRPHWGKLHFQTAETLAPRYPRVGSLPGRAPAASTPTAASPTPTPPRPRLTRPGSREPRRLPTDTVADASRFARAVLRRWPSPRSQTRCA